MPSDRGPRNPLPNFLWLLPDGTEISRYLEHFEKEQKAGNWFCYRKYRRYDNKSWNKSWGSSTPPPGHKREVETAGNTDSRADRDSLGRLWRPHVAFPHPLLPISTPLLMPVTYYYFLQNKVNPKPDHTVFRWHDITEFLNKGHTWCYAKIGQTKNTMGAFSSNYSLGRSHSLPKQQRMVNSYAFC